MHVVDGPGQEDSRGHDEAAPPSRRPIRASLRALDAALHLLPQGPAPCRNGKARAQRVPVALVFLYRNVLEREIGLLEDVVRAKRPARLPVVLTRDEARQLFAKMDGVVLLLDHLARVSSQRLPTTPIATPASATGSPA